MQTSSYLDASAVTRGVLPLPPTFRFPTLTISISKFIGVLLLLSGFVAKAQQNPMYTQYMTNPLTINPAIASSRKVANITSAVRKQWIGNVCAQRRFHYRTIMYLKKIK